MQVLRESIQLHLTVENIYIYIQLISFYEVQNEILIYK